MVPTCLLASKFRPCTSTRACSASDIRARNSRNSVTKGRASRCVDLQASGTATRAATTSTTATCARLQQHFLCRITLLLLLLCTTLRKSVARKSVALCASSAPFFGTSARPSGASLPRANCFTKQGLAYLCRAYLCRVYLCQLKNARLPVCRSAGLSKCPAVRRASGPATSSAAWRTTGLPSRPRRGSGIRSTA